MKFYYFVFVFFITSFSSVISQEYSWFYLRAKDTLLEPKFNRVNDQLIYIGNDIKLKSILNEYIIYEFKKTFKNAKKENLKKTFFVISNKEGLVKELLNKTSYLFEFGEIIDEEDKKIFEPNDYGLTSTIGANIGLQADLTYLDFLETSKAWYYTTGSPKTIIGLSDASVDTTNIEFKGKTKIIKNSSFSNGHGSGVASIAAAQGNNGFGVPGVCYDCNIYTTYYGDFKNFDQLLELSRLGVKVINCSWLNSVYYENAQAVIDEMFENGTIIVAASGNNNWNQTKGTKLYYPASYNHVISVSAGQYRYDSIYDNIIIADEGFPYAENIKGYVGRTVGFVNKDIKNDHYIFPVSTTTLNKEVAILAPSTGVLSYGKFLQQKKMFYDGNEHTSNATPLVTGTIGLMFSLYPCLPVDEVESIIKITSLNIGNIKANKPYVGKYGAGMLNAGKAVKLVYDLYTATEIAAIENQNFSRWDFKLTAFSKEVLIQNQKFTEDATLNLTAKNRIVIGENTVLKPNIKGSVILKIDSNLEKQCELQLREGFPDTKYYHPKAN